MPNISLLHPSQNTSRKYNLLFIFLILFLNQSISSEETLRQLSVNEEAQMLLNDKIRSEELSFNSLYQQGLNVIQQLNEYEITINENIFLFIDEKLTNEELFIYTDEVKKKISNLSDILSNDAMKINLKSEAGVGFYYPIYDSRYEIMNKIIDYIPRKSRLILNQIMSLEEWDIEKYDYFQSQSGISSIEFQLLMADYLDINTEISSSRSIGGYYILKIDSLTTRISSTALRINTLFIMDELNISNLREEAKAARKFYAVLSGSRLKRGLSETTERFSIWMTEPSLSLTINELKLIEEWLIDIDLFYDVSRKVSLSYINMIELFEDNSSDLTFTEESNIQGKKFDSINASIELYTNQRANLTVTINSGLIEIQNLIKSRVE